MKKVFVTTFNKSLYEKYAHEFISTYRNTNQEVPLYVFVEDDLSYYTKYDNIQYLSLWDHEPDCKFFIERNKHRMDEYLVNNFVSPGMEFAFDACRFSYKVFTQNAVRQYGDKIYFIDADQIFHKKIPDSWLEQALPDDVFVSFFDRSKGNQYTETGFICYNNTNPVSDTFFDYYLNLYKQDRVFNLPNFTDCESFDRARRYCYSIDSYQEKKLGDGREGSIMARDPWFSEYMQHRKGPSAKEGRSINGIG